MRIANGLGIRVVRVAPTECWGLGEVSRDADVIAVRKGLTPEIMAFVIAHEILEWAWLREGATTLRGPEKERWCDAGAAALLAPRLPFLDAARRLGPEFAQLGDLFGVTASCAALRYGEVTRASLALVAPVTVRLRGAPYGWPPRDQIRRLACLPAFPGMSRHRIASDRVALVAA